MLVSGQGLGILATSVDFDISHQSIATFQDALETVETLSDYQQEDLVDILRHRLTDRRRQEIADILQAVDFSIPLSGIVSGGDFDKTYALPSAAVPRLRG